MSEPNTTKLGEWVQEIYADLSWVFEKNSQTSQEAVMKSVVRKWRQSQPGALFALIVLLFLPSDKDAQVWTVGELDYGFETGKLTLTRELLDADDLVKALRLKNFSNSFFDVIFSKEGVEIGLGQFRKLEELMRDPRRTDVKEVEYSRL